MAPRETSFTCYKPSTHHFTLQHTLHFPFVSAPFASILPHYTSKLPLLSLPNTPFIHPFTFPSFVSLPVTSHTLTILPYSRSFYSPTHPPPTPSSPVTPLFQSIFSPFAILLHAPPTPSPSLLNHSLPFAPPSPHYSSILFYTFP